LHLLSLVAAALARRNHLLAKYLQRIPVAEV
jgi:hypothetical protein